METYLSKKPKGIFYIIYIFCNWWVLNRASFRHGCIKWSSGCSHAVPISRCCFHCWPQWQGPYQWGRNDFQPLLVFMLVAPSFQAGGPFLFPKLFSISLWLNMMGLTWITSPKTLHEYHDWHRTGPSAYPWIWRGWVKPSLKSQELNRGWRIPTLENVSAIIRRGNGCFINKNNRFHYIHFPFLCNFHSPQEEKNCSWFPQWNLGARTAS